MNIKAVIFDMDGLMIDSEPIQSQSFEQVLRHHGAEPHFHPNGLVQIIGINARDNWQKLKTDHQLEPEVDDLIAHKRRIYAELLKANIRPMPGLAELLNLLDNTGLKKAIASSSSLNHIEIVVTHLAPARPFDAVTSGEQFTRGKPHPDIFLKTANLLEIPISACMVLEDAESGIKAARAAKAGAVVAVPNRYTASHDFAAADHIIPSLAAINHQFLDHMF